jgi:hypothetical protein
MVTTECSLGADDLTRITRFIDTRPVIVSIESKEAVTHDIQRYCAYRQDTFHEQESATNPSLSQLMKARDSKMKILDSIDKYAPSPALE